ncbi:MAG: helicase-exonuclease AddAB subunit AddA, partial [Clostridia bacterium]|nr:helicase-exonuclease AddAB subunit AddA [Clostridia bacterium]
MNWTPEQREAIEYSGENILLAAAAGSGKTAVLVQRLIELIEKKKMSVNEILVLTFTDAAAGEMREKIKKAIAKALRENPEDEHMQKQRLLIHSASISTVHAFCMNEIKSNIHLTELPIDFSLVSDLENKIMLSEALDEVLELFYRNIDKDTSFQKLVFGYGGIKNDSTLRETVLSLHNFSRSMAYPARWLNDAVRPYGETVKTNELSGEWWNFQLKEMVEKSRDEIFELYDQILDEIERSLDQKHSFRQFIDDELAKLKRVFEHIDPCDYSSVRNALSTMKFETLRGGSRSDLDLVAAQKKIRELRGVAAGIFDELCKGFALSEDAVIDRIKSTYPVVKTLKNIVLMLDRRYTRKKRDKGLLDFNDLEHEALKLLVTKSGEATQVAEKLRKKYKAILVDEYQDTNNIQDLIFRTVSRDDENIFMVGDLKQSIYKFRNAVPKLFSEKYERYGKEENQGHLIRLFKNFRSRQGVVDTVNGIFRCIMSPEVGDIDYTQEEYLIQGAKYPDVADKKCFDTEFHLICSKGIDEDREKSTEQKKQERYELEARVAADRIKKIIDAQMEIYDKELDALRPVEYRDIVILMRKTKGVAPIFEKVFEESGIPVYSEVGHKYLESLEIQTILAILQIIDNPRQDIPLIATLRSPIWGFTPSELAKMRSESKHGCFFDVVEDAGQKGNEKAKNFIKELSGLRENSEYMGVDSLIYRIYYDFGYMAYVCSLDHGAERQANLRVLLERATEFEHTNMSGLFSFMNYIDTMIGAEKDMTPAKAFGEGENVVKIMSIHKSKGLEFPVVVLVNTSNEFYLKDAQKTIVWDERGGIGLECVDLEKRIMYASLSRTLVGLALTKDMISEEMRLLYVALTRAREKLIITSTMKANEKKWKKTVFNSQGQIPPGLARKQHTYKEWLLSAFMLHPKGKVLRELADIPESVVNKDNDYGLEITYYEDAEKVPIVSDSVKTAEDTAAYKEDISSEVTERLDFVY